MQYDKDAFEGSEYNRWTETRFFSQDQLQDCVVSEFSDQQWLISAATKNALRNDIIAALDHANEDYTFELGIDYKFDRDFPLTAKSAEQ